MINGTKSFITNSGTDITGLVTVTAVTGRGEGGRPGDLRHHRPGRDAGVHGRPRSTRRWGGWRRTPGSCRSSTAGSRRPTCSASAGRGYAQFLRILDEGRIAIAALSVGLAQGCIDECLRYVDEREAFGHKIGEYQVLQFKLADMEARTHVARLAYYDAAARLLDGRPFKKEAAIAKLVAPTRPWSTPGRRPRSSAATGS